MKTIVTSHSFIEAFCGRETQFTRPALEALFQYFEQVEEDTDTEITLDPITICCQWAEYSSVIEAANDNGFRGVAGDSEAHALDYLHEHTQVVEFSGGIVVFNR
jgi:hypothetical protein